MKEFWSDLLSSNGIHPGVSLHASDLHGLGGETLFHCRPAAVPPAFGVFRALVRPVRSWICRTHPRDGRTILLPIALSLCIPVLVCDSASVVLFAFQYGLSSLILLAWACHSVRTPLFQAAGVA
jgi:hypothetical protein